ncbi:uracil permease-like protein [Carex littledalei]|uniref:Uracil permease-like protein n=1 Tax=Carex littledalei TaxID=544730 RepID=A0A833RJF5_9POAL|nr:uracil permease-like protein [Carex littledalei]
MESTCLRLRLSHLHSLGLPIPKSQISPLKPHSISFPSTLHFSPLHSGPSITRLKLLPKSNSNPNPNPEGDLAPIPPSGRTFTAWNLASLWIGLVVGVPSYYLAGSLVDLGMSWLQGVSTIFLANALLLIPLILTAYPATALGIPFPVLARASFGPRGSHIPSLLRAFVACGMDGIRALEQYAAPILIVLVSALLGWAYFMAGGFGPMLSLPSRLSGAQFWAVFFPSLTANISFWATVAINIPDFTRYARSQKDQILGQIGLPFFMAVFTFAGLAVTSSTEVIFGQVIADPIQLLRRIGGPFTKVISIFGISLATVTTNIAANVVAPANALVSLNPKMFTFTGGAVVTALLGIAFQPWRLLSSSESFVYTWLLGYSALMGPIGGIVLSDYYLVKRMKLDLEGLYSDSVDGPYYYQNGFNIAALVALVAGVLPILPGFLHKVGILSNTSKVFMTAYNNAWFVSFFISGLVYWVLSSSRQNEKKPLYTT